MPLFSMLGISIHSRISMLGISIHSRKFVGVWGSKPVVNIYIHMLNIYTMYQKKSRKMSFYEGIDSRFEQMKKSKNKIELFLISSRSGRTDIPKYSVLGSF